MNDTEIAIEWLCRYQQHRYSVGALVWNVDIAANYDNGRTILEGRIAILSAEGLIERKGTTYVLTGAGSDVLRLWQL